MTLVAGKAFYEAATSSGSYEPGLLGDGYGLLPVRTGPRTCRDAGLAACERP